MAFFRSEFIQLDRESALYLKEDPETFRQFSIQMKYALEEALQGFENMSNFSYSTQHTHSGLTQDIFDFLQPCLRDTLMTGYEHGFDNTQETPITQHMRSLVRDALHYT